MYIKNRTASSPGLHRILHVTLESSPIPFSDSWTPLQALGTDVNPEGDGWSSRCPAHDDHTPTLRISRGDDGKLLDVLGGLLVPGYHGRCRLSEKDAFPPSSNGNGYHTPATKPSNGRPKTAYANLCAAATPSPDERASGTMEPIWGRL